MANTNFSKNSSSLDAFSVFSHRGFGEKTYARYIDKERLRFVHNELTGLEMGVENGAHVLELDLSKTKDGKIVTIHGNPFKQYLPYTEQEYLAKYPEVLTLPELLDWVYHQDSKLNLYLELKSPIKVEEIKDEIDVYAKHNPEIINRLYNQLILYTHDISVIKRLINDKERLNLSTLQLRIFWVSLGFINYSEIDRILHIGSDKSRIFGIEQGTFPWGFEPFSKWINLPIFPFSQIKKRLYNLSEVVEYAHSKNLQFIVGTIDDSKIIKILMNQKINGLVPNNPKSIYAINNPSSITKLQLKNHVPLSMKKRLSN